MMRYSAVVLLSLVAGAAPAADEKPKPKPNTLTPKEAAEGWIMLFDGATTVGWKTEGDVKVDGGVLVVNGVRGGKITTSTQFPVPIEVVAEWKWEGKGGALLGLGGQAGSVEAGEWTEHHFTVAPEGAGFRTTNQTRKPGGDWRSGIGTYGGLGEQRVILFAAEGATASVRRIKARPLAMKALFNGKDLQGWKVFRGDQKWANTKFAVTPAGELSAKNGPGDLQTEKPFDNFLLQLECKTNGKWLNSGVFFRCIPDQYQNGYEAQIQNAFVGDDRTKPVDFGTGAIYRRVPARRVVSNDNEWFTLTVAADGRHIATWVNGYQTVDWTDERPANDNPRQGYRAEKGHLSLQGHDPTTDLLFRNIRIAELPAAK